MNSPPKYTLTEVAFEGAENYSYDRLIEKAELTIGVPLNEYAIDAGARKLNDYFVERSHPEATVEYRIDKDKESGFATAVFEVNQGRKLHIRSIDFEEATTR